MGGAPRASAALSADNSDLSRSSREARDVGRPPIILLQCAKMVFGMGRIRETGARALGKFGLTVREGRGGKRVEMECEHQNGLLYVVPSESSWVCSDELMHAHALAGFFRQLAELEDERVDALMQRWGLYYRPRPLADEGGE